MNPPNNPYAPAAAPAMVPHRCPICVGHGQVPGGFYTVVAGADAWSSATAAEKCRACDGKGVIYTPPMAEAECYVFSIGVAEIAAERARQLTEEGFTAANDDTYTAGELLDAACCYVTARQMEKNGLGGAVPAMVRDLWPWSADWWRLTDAVRDLAKAGALIAAEIDRLKRAKAKEATS